VFAHDTTRTLAGLDLADDPVERIAALHAAAIDPDAAEFDSVLEILADAGCCPRAAELWGVCTAICPVHRLRTLMIWFDRIALPPHPEVSVICWRNAVLTCSLGCDDLALRDELGLTLVDIFPRHFREAA
jgi:hypothetical protein